MSRQETHLLFRLGGEPYSLPVQRVEEVLDYEEPTCIPRSPDYLLGVVNVRGRLIPVLNLRRRFGLPSTEMTTSSRFIVLNLSWGGETVPLGILVDAVEGVIDIDTDSISDPPGTADRGESDFLRGTVRCNDSIYLVLEVDRILTSDMLHNDFAAVSGGIA